MNERIIISRSAAGLRLVVPQDLRFDDYREIRGIADRVGSTRKLEIDISRVEALPTWFLGLLLHVEERLGVRLGVTGADEHLAEVFAITGMQRFIDDAPRERRADSVPATRGARK